MTRDEQEQPGAWYLDAAPATVAAWLTRLHWTRSAVEVTVVIASLLLSGADFPLRRLAPLVAATALIHLDIGVRRRRRQHLPRLLSATAITLDVLLLTGMLELSGGPSNPFSVVYAVAIAIAALTLGARWAWGIAALAAVSYGFLIAWHLEELVPAHHRLIDFPTHLFTMWLAVAMLGEALAYVIRDATFAIAHRERELETMRAQAARQERLMSLTTLAAGAAHELSTPLATIAVASRELERSLAAAVHVSAASSPTKAGHYEAEPAWVDDARLIREQVDRCHGILDQMSGRAGGTTADSAEPIELEVLFADLCQRLPPDQAARIRVRVQQPSAPMLVPRAGLMQVLLSLVKNAFDAAGDSRPVTVEGIQQRGVVQLIVRDEGPGMNDDVRRRAGEPFYTTKEPGRGLGLGLFLARMFAERCGGSLTLVSDRGTTATLELPLASTAPGAA